MNSGQEIARELVVSGGDAAEVLEPTKAALDDVSAFIGTLVEGMDDDAVGFVGVCSENLKSDYSGAEVHRGSRVNE